MTTKYGTEFFAKALAGASDREQAEFFNTFALYLKTGCRSAWDMQACFIADRLDSTAREVLKSLVDFAALAVENRARLESEKNQLYADLAQLREEKRLLEAELSTTEDNT